MALYGLIEKKLLTPTPIRIHFCMKYQISDFLPSKIGQPIFAFFVSPWFECQNGQNKNDYKVKSGRGHLEATNDLVRYREGENSFSNKIHPTESGRVLSS